MITKTPFHLRALLGATSLLVLLTCAPEASAYEITLGGAAAADGSGLTSAVGAATVVDFNSLATPTTGAFTLSGVTFIGDGEVVSGSTGSYTAPAGDMTNYLVAAGSSSNYAGNEDALTIGGANNYFGLYWGSIDAFNTLSFYNNGSLLLTVTGSEVAAPGTANGSPTSVGTNNYVNLFDLPTYDAVVLSTSQANFEVDNLAFGTVPEPGTFALFGLGLLGIGLTLRGRIGRANGGGTVSLAA